MVARLFLGIKNLVPRGTCSTWKNVQQLYFLILDQMLHTYQNQNQKAELLDIFSWENTILKASTMEQS